VKLEEILALSKKGGGQKVGLSEERLTKDLDGLRNLISFFREYPDIFIDFIKGKDSNF
jgi:hypothetical protein